MKKIVSEEILDESPFEFIYDNSVKVHPFRRFQLMFLDMALKRHGEIKIIMSIYKPSYI